jgi:hypothetical protein
MVGVGWATHAAHTNPTKPLCHNYTVMSSYSPHMTIIKHIITVLLERRLGVRLTDEIV